MLIRDSTAQTVNHLKEKHNEIAMIKSKTNLVQGK